MTFSQKIKKGLVASLLSNRLTISGEIIISKSGMNTLDPEEIETSGLLDEALAAFAAYYPAISVQILPELCDVTIKLFAVEKKIYGPAFYDTLEEIFTDLVKHINEKEDLQVRLNVYGEFQQLNKREKFRFLNKGELVSHKIVSTSTKFCPGHSLRKKMAHRWVDSEDPDETAD